MGVRAVLTGGRGFVGARLAKMLRGRHPDWTIDTPDRWPEGGEALDVTSVQEVDAWVRERRPDVVVHLAAVSAVTAAAADPRAAWRVNLEGTLNVVLALQAHAPDAHLMLISSAEVYGRSLDSAGAVSEGALLQPVNPYAASKAAADLLVRQAAAGGLSTSVMRAFNHTGAGQSELFVVPAFAAQIARIEIGLQPPILQVGSLDEERDFLSVEDVVAAYADVLAASGRLPSGSVFNVASGVPVRIGDVLEELLTHASVRVEVQVDAARRRSTPIQRIVGDASRLRDAVGWAPTRSLSLTLEGVLAYERGKLSKADR